MGESARSPSASPLRPSVPERQEGKLQSIAERSAHPSRSARTRDAAAPSDWDPLACAAATRGRPRAPQEHPPDPAHRSCPPAPAGQTSASRAAPGTASPRSTPPSGSRAAASKEADWPRGGGRAFQRGAERTRRPSAALRVRSQLSRVGPAATVANRPGPARPVHVTTEAANPAGSGAALAAELYF